jgi:hypothetical protein
MGTRLKTWMPGHSRPKDGVLSHAYVPGMTTETPRQLGGHRLPRTWVQMAIIPTNNDREANAAASWSTALNMAFMVLSPEQRENIVQSLFLSQGRRNISNKAIISAFY